MDSESLDYVSSIRHILEPFEVVYNHWTGTVDWNGGMEWWNRKFSKNEAKRSHFLMREDINSDLMASLAYTEVKFLS